MQTPCESDACNEVNIYSRFPSIGSVLHKRDSAKPLECLSTVSSMYIATEVTLT